MSFFSRDELLRGGFPARRASLLLFAIENRTSQLAAQDMRDAAVYLTFAGTPTREQDFFAALAHGRQGSAHVTIQHIERYALGWQSLLPQDLDPKLNAALAQLLGAKYKFTRRQLPNVRAVLRLDDAAVQQEFQRAFDQPLETIFAPQVGLAERARFGWTRFAARLENMPPFWLAFLLTLPGAAGLLAMPVALAGLGLGGGLTLLLTFGLINLLTVVALAEATARSGVTRFGLGWLGQLVEEYLGRAGSVFLTIILALNNFFVLIIFFLGVGGILQDATQIPTTLWMAVLGGICVFFLSRGSLNATIASTLLIVLFVVALLLVIPAVALPQWRVANITAAPFFTFDLAALSTALGLMLSTYFSHLLVATYGSVVLRREASGRAWMRGSAAAILGFMLIASLWLIVINGTIPPDELARTPGTVLTPLAERVGPSILWLGSLLVILSLGLACVQIALGLFYMVQERLPAAFAPPRPRFIISIAPIVGVLVIAEYLALTGNGSFSRLLGILGAVALPLLAGVLPVLLVASTRRRGDFVPDRVPRLLGNPIVLTVVYLFFVGILFAYALVIFQETWTRALMLLVGVVTVAVTLIILRGGALAPRAVIQVRDDQRGVRVVEYRVVADGAPVPVKVELDYQDHRQTAESAVGELEPFEQLRGLRFVLGVNAARSLKVWAYRLPPDGGAHAIPARVDIHNDSRTERAELNQSSPHVTVSLSQGALYARLQFERSGKSL